MNLQDHITAIGAGDRQAFRALYTLFSDKVYNTALSYVLNEKDAEEVTQDVFVKIYQHAAKFRGQAAVGTWIYRITVNAALNQIKKKKRFTFLKFGQTVPDLPVFNHPGVQLEKSEDAQLLFKAIEQLPETQKTAFILSFVEELPRQEVADIMETSLKAVESLLQRAKKNLRSSLEKWYPHRKKK